MKKKIEKATVGISREIWFSDRETGRFDENLRDSWENRGSWQVIVQSIKLVRFVERLPTTWGSTQRKCMYSYLADDCCHILDR